MTARNLLIHFGALGDVIVSLPCLQALSRVFPGPWLAWGQPDFLSVALKSCVASGPLDGLWQPKTRDQVELYKAGQPLPESFDAFERIVLFHDDPVLAPKIRALGPERGWVLPSPRQLEARSHGRIQGRSQVRHVAEQLLEELPKSWRRDQSAIPEIHTKPSSSLSEPQGRPYFTLHPGAGGARKRWPGARWRALLERLREHRPEWWSRHRLMLILGPADEPDLVEPFEGLGATVKSAMSLPALASLLASSCWHWGHDSGPSHLAAAVACPLLVLFGPSPQRLWQPRSTRSRVTTLAAAGGCFDNLEVSAVFQQLLQHQCCR